MRPGDLSHSPRIIAVRASLEARPGVTGDPPFAPGEDSTRYKVKGKMFAILIYRRMEAVIVKCDPALVDILKEQYAGVGHRGHLDRRAWICIDLAADVPPEEVERLVAASHALICAGLTKKERAELAAQG